jgi:hypothetical protein
MRIPHSVRLLDREHLDVPEVKRIIRDSLEHSKHSCDTKYVPTAELPALIRSIYAQHPKIPVRVINGDSHPHVDKADDGKAHKRTSLLYLEGDGHLFLGDTKIPIRPGLCVEFDAGVKHWTEGSKKTKVMLGPMSERGGPVRMDNIFGQADIYLNKARSSTTHYTGGGSSKRCRSHKKSRKRTYKKTKRTHRRKTKARKTKSRRR